MKKSTSDESLCSAVSVFNVGSSVTKRATAAGSSTASSDGTDAHVPRQFPCTSRFRRRRKASPRMQRNGSAIAALVTSVIFLWAIRSCIPPEVTTWHKQQQQQYLPPRASTPASATREAATTNASIATTHVSNATTAAGRRRLDGPTLPDKGGGGLARYADPRTTVPRQAAPLATPAAYRVDPLVKPDGYPWHRWGRPRDGSYALDARKFVAILARLGGGEDTLGTVSPFNYTSGGVPLRPGTIRLGPRVRPYIVRNGTVLRPGGRPGMFVTLVQRAVELAATWADRSPRLRLLADGEFPLVFDSTDYPWCGDDLVPVFRLNQIADATKCKHAWPAMSLTYFSDPANVQLTETPAEWDAMMAGWERRYPWEGKADQVVWRGRITGYTYRDGERPRQALVKYAQRHLDVMDVKPLTRESQMDQDDFQKSKAILDIDGNAWSSRLGKLLCFNSVVIKIRSTYVGYWEKELQPWVHYIPAEPDFSDLEKRVRYALDPKNAAQVQQITRNGQQFCRTKLTMEQYTVDLLWSLQAYAELLDGSPDFHRVWRENKSAYQMEGQEMAPFRRPSAGGRAR